MTAVIGRVKFISYNVRGQSLPTLVQLNLGTRREMKALLLKNPLPKMSD